MTSNNSGYAWASYRVWASVYPQDSDPSKDKPISGLEELPVNSVTVNYEMGAIPTCDMGIAIGTDISTGKLSPMQVASNLAKFYDQVRIQVWAAVLDRTGIIPGWWGASQGQVTATRLLFDGVVAVTQFARSLKTNTMSLSCAHWSMLLADSVISNSAFLKVTPGSLQSPYSVVGPEGKTYTGDSVALSLIDEAEGSDPWAVILGWFETLMCVGKGANVPVIWSQALEGNLMNAGPSPITENLFTKANDVAYKLMSERVNVGPGSPTLFIGIDNALLHSFYTGAQSIICQNLSSSTLLDKLFTLAQYMGAQIVPTVSKLFIAPVCPALASNLFYKKIARNEYDSIQGQGTNLRRIAGLGLMGSLSELPSLDTDQQAAGLIATYGVFSRGQVILTDAPAWASEPLFAQIANTSSKDQKVDPSVKIKLKATADAASRVLGGTLAEAMWAAEVFRGRQAELSGPPRLDICPGSVVCIDSDTSASPSVVATVQGEDPTQLYAVVQGVRMTLDVNSKQAFTKFRLQYVHGRMASGAKGEGILNLQGHPLLTGTGSPQWLGCPLTA